MVNDRVWLSDKGAEVVAKKSCGGAWSRFDDERRHVERTAVRWALDDQFVWLGDLAGFTMESGDLTGVLPMLVAHRCGWTGEIEQHAYVANIVQAVLEHRQTGCADPS